VLPVQRFQVQATDVLGTGLGAVLIISLETIRPVVPMRLFKVVARPGLAHRCSRCLHDRDDRPAGPRYGDRFLPAAIDGEIKLDIVEHGARDSDDPDVQGRSGQGCQVSFGTGGGRFIRSRLA